MHSFLPLLLLSSHALALQPCCTRAATIRAPLQTSPRHPVLVAAAKAKPAPAAAAPENPALPLQLTAFVFVFGLSLVTLIPTREVMARLGTEKGMALLTLLASTSAGSEIVLSPLVGGLTDSVGRKPVLLITVASVFAANLATAVCPTVPLIALSRFVSNLVVGIFFLSAGAILADRLRAEPAKLAAASGTLFALVNGGFGLGIAASGLLPAGLSLRTRYGISALVSLLGVGLASRVKESLADADRVPFQVRSFNPFAFTRLFFMGRAMRLLAVLAAFTLAPLFMGDTLQARRLPRPLGPSAPPSPRRGGPRPAPRPRASRLSLRPSALAPTALIPRPVAQRPTSQPRLCASLWYLAARSPFGHEALALLDVLRRGPLRSSPRRSGS